jgi:hypothetical protein
LWASTRETTLCFAERMPGRSSDSFLPTDGQQRLRAVEELRALAEDPEWLADFIDYLHDLSDRKSPSVRQGLEELARGDIEPA